MEDQDPEIDSTESTDNTDDIPSYDQMLVQHTENAVRQSAQRQGVPEDFAVNIFNQETGKEMGIDPDNHTIDENVDAGVGYAKKMLDQNHGNRQLAAAAYNAGQGRVNDGSWKNI